MTAIRSGAIRPSGPAFCGFCATANHRLCPGACACASVEHRPGLDLRVRFHDYLWGPSDLSDREKGARWARRAEEG